MAEGNGGFGGLGRPGQRETSVQNFESRVTIPVAQFLIVSVIAGILAVVILAYLFMVAMTLGAHNTWLVVFALIVAIAFGVDWLLRKWTPYLRWQYSRVVLAIAFTVALLWWLWFGWEYVVIFWPIGFEVPAWATIATGLFLGPAYYFAVYFLFGVRNDMADSNWPPTRTQLPGAMGPWLPGTRNIPLVPEPSQPSPILWNPGVPAPTWEIPNQTSPGKKRRIPITKLADFFKASEVANRGLSGDVAKASGFTRDEKEDIIHELQRLGLAQENGKGKIARLVYSWAETLRNLGFDIDRYANTDDEPDSGEYEQE